MKFIKQGIYAVILVAVAVGVVFGISLFSGTSPVSDVQAAESEDRAGQVHLQQESVMQFYEKTFPERPSIIIPSASNAVNVSVTVLENLSLLVVDGQPKYATNWKFGASVYKETEGDSIVYWTVTADYQVLRYLTIFRIIILYNNRNQ